MIPGNHEYSFGTERLAKLIDRFALPVVATNVIWPEGMEPEHAVPHRLFDLDGVTVAVIARPSTMSPAGYELERLDEAVDFPLESLEILTTSTARDHVQDVVLDERITVVQPLARSHHRVHPSAAGLDSWLGCPEHALVSIIPPWLHRHRT